MIGLIIYYCYYYYHLIIIIIIFTLMFIIIIIMIIITIIIIVIMPAGFDLTCSGHSTVAGRGGAAVAGPGFLSRRKNPHGNHQNNLSTCMFRASSRKSRPREYHPMLVVFPSHLI